MPFVCEFLHTKGFFANFVEKQIRKIKFLCENAAQDVRFHKQGKLKLINDI
jgi:hypothetical protein